MEKFAHITGFASKIADYGGRLGVLAMMIIVVANVILREVWKSITGTYDYVAVIAAILVGLSLAYCAYTRGHIEVEILMERFSKGVQRVVASVITLASLGFFSVVTWQFVVLANEMKAKGETTMTTYMPLHPFMYVVAIGLALLILVILGQFLRTITGKGDR